MLQSMGLHKRWTWLGDWTTTKNKRDTAFKFPGSHCQTLWETASTLCCSRVWDLEFGWWWNEDIAPNRGLWRIAIVLVPRSAEPETRLVCQAFINGLSQGEACKGEEKQERGSREDATSGKVSTWSHRAFCSVNYAFEFVPAQGRELGFSTSHQSITA